MGETTQKSNGVKHTEDSEVNLNERRKSMKTAKKQEERGAMANLEVTGMNAKARRKAMRAARQKDEKAVVLDKKEKTIIEVPAVERNLAGMNAKARRKALRSAKYGEPADPTKLKVEKKHVQGKQHCDEQLKKRKRVNQTVFLGQLPFDCTQEMIKRHFEGTGEFTVRMLTDRNTQNFRGIAFVDYTTREGVDAALEKHHTLMNGRRINVELTAGGGGNTSEKRTKRLRSLRKIVTQRHDAKTKNMVEKFRSENPQSKLRMDDIDDRALEFLTWFDIPTAQRALHDFSRCLKPNVKNRKAFLMGILKRYRSTDGVEGPKGE